MLCGIEQAYPFYKKKLSEEEFKKFTNSYISAISMLMLIICVIAVLGVTFTYKFSIEVSAIVLITPILVYYKIISYCASVDKPNKKNIFEFFINIFEIFYMIFLVLFVKKNIIAGISTIIIKDFILSIIYSKQLGFKLSINKESLGLLFKLSKFGFFPMLSVLMTTLNYRIDTIMLKGYVDYSSIGVYSVGVSIAEKIWVIPDAMRDIMISKVASGKKVDEVSMVIRVCNTVCILIFIGMLLVSKPLIALLYGAEYSGAYSIIIIILLGTITMTYFKMIASYFIVINKQKISLIFLTISVITNVIVDIILIPKFNIYGAAWASTVAYLICAMLFLGYFSKTEKVKLKDCLIISKRDVRSLRETFKK